MRSLSPIVYLSCIAVASVAAGSAHAAAVTWDGAAADGSWQSATNWDPDGVPGTADDVTIGNGDAVTYTPGGDFVVDGGSLTISGGSSWTQSPTNWSQINGGTLTLDNGTFTRTGGGNLVLAIADGDSGVVNMTNGSVIDLGGELWFGRDVGGQTNQTANLTLNDSSIDANGGVGIWFWDPDAAGNDLWINFEGTATSTVEARVGRRNAGGSNNSVTWETLWNEGVLRANGGNVGAFGDYFTTSGTPGTSGYTLTYIPQPGSAALGLIGLALVASRRRHA